MKKEKSILLFVFIIMLFFKLNGQNQVKLSSIIPPSPEASSIGKFIATPISLYTGLPKINVPIFNIPIGDKMEFINLSYHAKGIKVEEIASRVGLGWALNSGGIITRQIRGKADDENGGYLRSNYLETFFTDENTRIAVMAQETNNGIDLEADVFMFNILGHSGKFIFDQKTKQTLLQKFDNLIINPIYSSDVYNSIIIGWNIKDALGYEYIYDGGDKAQNKMTYIYSQNNGLSTPVSLTSSVFNTWKIIKITAPNGEVIDFVYENENVVYLSRSYDIAESSGEKKSYFSKNNMQQSRIKTIFFKKGSLEFTYQNTIREDLQNGHALESIKIYNNQNQIIEQFQFNYHYSEALNLNNQNPHINFLDPASNKRLILDNIYKNGQVINEFVYNTENLPSRFSTSQDNWGYYNGKDNGYFLTFFNNGIGSSLMREIDTIKAEAGLLKKIIYPTKGSVNFEYEHNKVKPPSFMDELFFSNNNPTISKQAGLIKNPNLWNGSHYTSNEFEISIGKVGEVSFNVTIVGDGNCDSQTATTTCPYQIFLKRLDDNGNTMDTGHLFIGQQDINLVPGKYIIEAKPTRGVENPYDFEGEYFAVSMTWEEQIIPDLEVLYGPGKRIKSITYKDFDDSIKKKLSYTYLNEQGECSGRMFSFPNYYYINKKINKIVVIDGHGSRSGSVLGSHQGNSIGYQYVTEYISDVHSHKGKTQTQFTIVPDQGEFYKFPYSPPTDNEWLRGDVIASKTYKWNVSKYDIENLIFNEYKYNINAGSSILIDPIIAELDWKIYFNNKMHYNLPFILFGNYNDGDTNLGDLGDSPMHDNYRTYFFRGGIKYLSKKTEISYFDNTTPITNIFNYDFDNNEHYQLSTITQHTDNKNIKTTFKYPSNLIGQEQNMQELVNNNIIAEPIITKKFIIKNNIEKLLSTKKIKFNAQLLPSKIQTAKGNNPLEDRIIYHQYDNAGNPLEVSKANGTHVCYVWGYNKSQPIAKIENIAYTNLPIATLNTLQNFDYITGTEQQLLTALQNFRSALPVTAMVTTMTYKPLIGVSTITGPKGDTQKYFYDNFNRLQFVKDKDGNILSENAYHYKN